MVQGHAVSYADAPVVAHEVERGKPKLGHHLELVLCHGAERVDIHVLIWVGRLFAVPIAAQIWGDHRVTLGQLGRDLVPLDVSLRVAMR